MSVTPFIENLHQIKDTVTGKTFACTVTAMKVPFDWRTAITASPTADGGVDAHAGGRDYLAPRAIDVTLVHVYTGAETFKVVMNALENVIGRGNPLELTFEEEDATIWLWNVRLTKFDKTLSLDWAHHVEIPLSFIAADPRQRALFKPGILLLDNGLFLDDTPIWLLDVDPDNVALTGTSTTHAITNTGPAPDEAPVVSMVGPITGPIYVFFYDDVLNQLYWAYTNSIAAGETVTVDPTQPEVTSTNAAVNAYAAFALGPNQDSWGRIAPGANTVLLQCAGYGTNAAFSINWSPRK